MKYRLVEKQMGIQSEIKQFVYPEITDCYLFREMFPLQEEVMDKNWGPEWERLVKEKNAIDVRFNLKNML